MSKSSVRDAFETSVACRPVSLKVSHESMVPKTASLRAVDVLEEPLDLGPGEVRVEDEPVRSLDQVLVTGFAQLVAARSRAAVLPHECVVDRLAGDGIPRDDGLALVGDPDRVQRGALRARVGERLAGDARA